MTSMRRLLLTAWLAILPLWLPGATARADGLALPPGFTDSLVSRPDGLPWNDAMGATVAADGRLFVWERAGRVWVVDPKHPHPAPIVDLSREVGTAGELGLTGFALDPNFAANGRLYLFYSVDPGFLASCASPPSGPPTCHAAGRIGRATATTTRITRYTLARPAGGDLALATAVDPASRVVLLGEGGGGQPAGTGCVVTAAVHGAGSLAFGTDGTLLASCGDGARADGEDLGGNDSAGAVALGLMTAGDDVGAFRAQRLDSLSGKVLRLDPATGDGLASNPFFVAGEPRAARSRVWLLGLRDPLRFAVRPGSGLSQPANGAPGTLYLGDAGQTLWQSLDVARGSRLNFGWPLYEGMESDSVTGYRNADVADAGARNPLYPYACSRPYFEYRDLLQQDTLNGVSWPNPCRRSVSIGAATDVFLHTRPAIDWNNGHLVRWAAFGADGSALSLPLGTRAANGATVSGPLLGGSHSVGGAWYTAQDFPAPFRDVYFHADAGAGWIKAFRFDVNDNPVAVTDFASNAGAVRSLAAGPAGGLYVVTATGTTTVHRLTYAAPAVQTVAAPAAAAATSASLAAPAAATATVPVLRLMAATTNSVASPLTAADVGAVTTAGTYGYNGTTYALAGAGADIFGTADAFQFYSLPLSGDGRITARVAAITAADPWTKAGVMIRESLAAGAVNGFVGVSAANGSLMSIRTSTGASSTSTKLPGIAAPYWVRLSRNGTQLTGAVSADGLSWTQISQATLVMATQAYAGLAMTSHSTGVASANFDSVTVLNAPSAPTGLNAQQAAGAVTLNWTAAAAGTNGVGGYTVYRADKTAAIGTTTTTSFTDSSVVPGTTYSYYVVAFDKTTPTAFASAPSASVSVLASAGPMGPGVPGGLAVSVAAPTSLTLQWNAATVGTSPIGGYYVYRNGGTTPYATVSGATNTTFTDTGLAPATTYTYAVAAFDTASPTPLVSAPSASLAATTAAAQVLSGSDIGITGATGSYAISGSTVTVNGAGSDIWGTADSFQFVSQPFTGDGTVTARVVSQTNTNAWAKAGVMIRASLTAGSAQVVTAVSPSQGVMQQYRNVANGSTTHVQGATTAAAPYWVRLNRAGNIFTSSVSPDGVTWTVIGQTTVTMAASAYAGLAVSSHAAGVLSTVAFDNVSFSGGGLVPPASPTGLVASNVTASAVTLNWTAALPGTNPVAGYAIYRNGTRIGYVTGTTYTDGTVAAATTYAYAVVACDSSVPTPMTSAAATLSATTSSVITAPTGPAKLSATASSSSIVLSWPAATPGTNPVAGYYVYRNGATTPSATVTGATNTTYTDPGLSAATTYTYTVAAFDTSTPTPLVSAPTAPLAVTTAAAPVTAPGVPAALTLGAVTTTSVTFSWTAPAAGTNPIGGYYVYRNGATTPTVTVTGAANTSYTDPSLLPSTTYTYTVAAFDNASTPHVSAPSAALTATTASVAPPAAPGAPGSPSVSAALPTSLTLKWTSASAGTNPIGGYYVYRNGATTPTATVTGAANTTYTDTGLTPATTYTYTVAAFDSTTPTPLVSAPSATVSGTTTVAQMLSGTDIGATGATGGYTVSGTTVTVNGAGADIWGTADAFQFVAQPFTGDGTITARVVSQTNTNVWAKAGVMIRAALTPGSTHVLTAVTPGQGAVQQYRSTTGGSSSSVPSATLVAAPYWVRLTRAGSVFTSSISPDGLVWTVLGQTTVAMPAGVYAGLAVSSHTTGVLSTVAFDNVTFSGGGLVVPGTPGTLAAGSVSASAVTLNWTASAPGSNPVAGYAVYRNGTRLGLVTGTTYTDPSVSGSTTYAYSVVAYDSSVPTPLTSAAATLSVTTPTGSAVLPPSAPSALTAVTASSSSITLVWSGATAGTNPIAGYQVYRNGGSTPIATVSGATTYTDTGLAPSTVYNYAVVAFDSSSPPLSSAPSPSTSGITATATGSTPPGTPGAPVASAATLTTLTLTWPAATPGSNPIGGYFVYRNGSTTPLVAVAGTSYTDTGLTAGASYQYTVRAYDTSTPVALLSAPSASLSAATAANGFADQDIGATGAAGSAALVGTTYTVNGSGADIWSTGDAFNFDAQPVTGDFTITARIVSQTNTNAWAKAGVMVRETLAAGSTHAFMALTPSSGATFQSRPVTNGSSTSTQLAAVAPYWVRLNRTGNLFTGFVSPDGVNWTAVSTITIAMASPAYVGLAVTSHSAGSLSTGVFDSVSLGGSATTVTPLGFSPRNASVLVGGTVQLTASVYGQTTGAVAWSVDGVAGGNATVGTISATGLYTAPATPGTHTVGVSSTNFAGLSGSGTVGVSDVTAVTTYHGDNSRSGVYAHEYALNTATVGASTFGKLFSCVVDGDVYAQPLYVANLSIGGGVHNVVFVATMHDSVYAFDADSPSCVQYWKTAYVTPSGSVTSVPVADLAAGGAACTDINNEVGIVGTPVIDPVAGTLYFVAKTKESGAWVQRLHALNVSTGAERVPPVAIGATVSGATFSPLWQNQRPALALNNGQVYIGWGSHCDYSTWYGWLMAYNATTLAQTAAFNVAPRGAEGGIWMSGGGPAIDSSGNLYVTTGNGTFDYTSSVVPPLAPNADYGESYLKLSLSTSGQTGSLQVADFYTPSQNAAWTANDQDLSASGVVVLPDGTGPTAHPNLVLGADKQAHIWLLDRSPAPTGSTSMGGFSPTADNVVQYLNLPGTAAGCANHSVFGTPSYWNKTVYVTVGGNGVMGIPLANGVMAANGGVAAPTLTSSESYGFPAPTTVISTSPGSTAGLLWTLDDSAYGGGNCNLPFGPAVLRAYDATTLKTLYTSAGQTRDTAGGSIKFQLPVVANGHVYVGGSAQLTVYGLLP